MKGKNDNRNEYTDEQLLRSYNEEFYSTLSNLKIMSMPLVENKLFYNFEQNDNASVSSTTGQLLVSYEELNRMSLELQDQIIKTKEEIKILRNEYENCGKNIQSDYKDEIIMMRNRLQSFLVEQKTENFKLIKEIAIMEKEKLDLQNNIYYCLGKLHKLEKEVGVKTKAYTYLYDQSILDNEISNKFIIEREEI